MLNTFKKSQDLYKNRSWLTLLVLVTLGTMVLAVCSLLIGCGSDSKPQAVSGKKEKTANTMKLPVAIPLDDLGKFSGRGTTKREPSAAGKTEISPGTGVTVEEIEEKWAETLKRTESPNYEILPGMTKQQLEAKIAAAQQNAQKKPESPNYEIIPGMTKAELNNKVEAARRQLESQHREAVPGITKDELNDKIEAARRKSESQK